MGFSVAFDLDSTLGSFESIHPYLIVFFPDILQQVYKAPHYKGRPFPKLNISESDKRLLAKAFETFVLLMAKREEANKLLRPGILDIIKALLKAKKRGLIDGMMIYSSNSNPYVLLFAERLIQTLLNSKEAIFNPLVHWWHPLRNSETRPPGTNFGLGHGPKTVQTIVKALGPVKEKDILFFDDLIHPDIFEKIPNANYFHVERYQHSGIPLVIYSCFIYSLMKYNLDTKPSILNEYKKIGLLIGKTNEDIQSFKRQVPTGVNLEIQDTESILHRLADLLERPTVHLTTIRKIKNASKESVIRTSIITRGGKKTRKIDRLRLKVFRTQSCLD